MRLGLTLWTSSRGLRETVRAAVAAERMGVHTLYLVERHFDPEVGYANAFAVAAAVSGVLERAWIGVQPMLGLDHPLRLVEQSNMLDVLMRGRCVIVLTDAADAPQYRAFGLPTPQNGLLEDLLHQMEAAWAWQFKEDGPPLDFQSGRFAARMAGRIMPSPYRMPRPLLVRETDTEVGVLEAARHGWAVHLRDTKHVKDLVDVYRRELSSIGTAPVTALLDRLSVRLETRPDPSELRHLAECGIAEVRLDTPSQDTLKSVLSVVKEL